MIGMKPSLLLPSDKTQYPECPVSFQAESCHFYVWLDQAKRIFFFFSKLEESWKLFFLIYQAEYNILHFLRKINEDNGMH